MMFLSILPVIGQIQAGTLRALAVASPQRSALVPDVPTIAESGMPDFEVTSWQGLCTQSGVPPAALEKLRTTLAAVLGNAETRKRIADQGFQVHVLPGKEFSAYARAERAKWGKLVKAIGIDPQ
jgi:tripartite-type tricarboxylate transporter receptor subunit TctC